MKLVPGRNRTRGREIALQALYQYDIRRKAGETDLTAEVFEPFLEEATEDQPVKQYARTLLDGVLSAVDEIDQRIVRAVEHWKLERIAPIDRCVLRLALFELLEGSDVPPKVAINEAIDLAKKFSTEQSGSFVNGILDRIFKESSADVDGESADKEA